MLEAPSPAAEATPRPFLTGLRRQLPFLLGLSISAIFTWLFVRKLQFGVLAELPSRLRYGFVLIAVGIFLGEFILRSIRWKILMSPLGKVSARPLLAATFIGFMANNLLPARAGELIRPLMAARKLELPLEKVLITTIMERVFDLIGLLSVFLLTTALLPYYRPAALSEATLHRISQAGTVLGSVGILGLATLFVLAAREAWTHRVVEKLCSRLPLPVGRLAMRLYLGLAAGLATFRTFRGPTVAVLLSVVIWMNGALAIWIMTWAFGFYLPFAGACFLGCTLALAVSVPQAPGFIGVWQVAVSETLIVWGVPMGQAQGFALVFWLVSFAPVTLIGLGMLWGQGLHVRQLAELRTAEDG